MPDFLLQKFLAVFGLAVAALKGRSTFLNGISTLCLSSHSPYFNKYLRRKFPGFFSVFFSFFCSMLILFSHCTVCYHHENCVWWVGVKRIGERRVVKWIWQKYTLLRKTLFFIAVCKVPCLFLAFYKWMVRIFYIAKIMKGGENMTERVKDECR